MKLRAPFLALSLIGGGLPPAFAGPGPAGPVTVPPIADSPPPALPADQGPITTPTFTLSAARPFIAGRGALSLEAVASPMTAADSYRVSASFGAPATLDVILDPALRSASFFIACHVTNDSPTAPVYVGGFVGLHVNQPAQIVAPRTARWFVGWELPITGGTAVIDRCEVTGFGASSTPPLTPSHALASLRKKVAAARASAPPAQLPSGAVATGIVLSAQQPTSGGAALRVTTTAAKDTNMTARVLAAENAYTFEAFTFDPRFDGRSSTVEARVTVPRTPGKTAAVSCSVSTPAPPPPFGQSRSGPTMITKWIDVARSGASGADDVFTLRYDDFWGEMTLNECRVWLQVTAAPPVAGPTVAPPAPPLRR